MVLDVACEDKVVIVELSQLAVETLVALKFLDRREDAATLGALRNGKNRMNLEALDLGRKKTHKQKIVFYTNLINKKCSHKFPWLEHLHHLPHEIVIRCLGEVGFKAHVGEIWLWSDVDGPISSLQNRQSHVTEI